MEKRESALATVEAQPAVLKLTPQAIAVIAENIAMAEQLVGSVLEAEVDYGRIPGLPGMSLFDPGAAKISAAFNCHPDHEVLFHEESDEVISWTIQAKLVSHQVGAVVATGMGAASTRETKYKYRWVPDPENYGCTPAEIKDLKTKPKDGKTTYRIQNPEYGELVNTLLQMASKRAEVDAVKNLPGVGSALRKLFGGKKLEHEPDWPRFWGMVKNIGIAEGAVHTILKVSSMKDWVAQGRTLDEAIETLARTAFSIVRSMQKKAGFGNEPDAPEVKKVVVEPPVDKMEPQDLTEDDFPDASMLIAYAKFHWGLDGPEIWEELNYDSQKNFQDAGVETAWQCWKKLRDARIHRATEE